MAIKNTDMGGTDWVDAETLYAVDLNDTFDACLTQAGAFSGSSPNYTLKEDYHILPKTAATSNIGSEASYWDKLFLKDAISFEGSTDNDYQTTFVITNPTADRTITFPDSDVTIGASSGANTSLSNLSSVAVNTNIIPGASDAYNLGSTDYGWKRIYLEHDSGSADGRIEFLNTDDNLQNRWYIFAHDNDPSIGDGMLIFQPNNDGDDVFIETGMQITGNLTPDDDCNGSCGTSSRAWYRLYYQTGYSGSCDIAELAGVHEPYSSGTVVELAPATEEQKELEAKELEVSKKKKKKNPIHHRNDKFHFHHGLKASWKKADARSTKCPSIVSFVPSSVLNSSPNKDKAQDEGKMRPIVLSGSVPFVMVNGEFNEGDILVSAGGGNAMVDNDAPPNQWIGWALESGNDRRIEVWIK